MNHSEPLAWTSNEEEAFHEIELDIQRRAADAQDACREAAAKIKSGLATISDAWKLEQVAIWIGAEYGLTPRTERK